MHGKHQCIYHLLVATLGILKMAPQRISYYGLLIYHFLFSLPCRAYILLEHCVGLVLKGYFLQHLSIKHMQYYIFVFSVQQ